MEGFLKCPLCEGEFDPISLRVTSGEVRRARRCSQCGGFWFDRDLDMPLSAEAVAEVDSPNPNYSLQSLNLLCPDDQTVLEQSEHDAGPNGFKMWSCPDCKGAFYPRGQLALYVQWLSEQGGNSVGGFPIRTQAALAVMMTALGGVLSVMAFQSMAGQGAGFLAASAEPLPTAGPNILTLVLLALAYLAGTVLAVLGRRVPIIFMGWGVIAICLFGFFVIIFGP